jgi:hypothetical protein
MVKRNYIWRYANKKRSDTAVLDSRLRDGGEVISFTRRPRFTPQKDSWYLFLLAAESTAGP